MIESATCKEIQLYVCHKCAKPYHQDWIDRGEACHSCGSRQIAKAPPNFRNVSAYLVHNPGLIPAFVMENLLKWR